MIDPALIAFGGVVMAGYAVQTVTGFGSMLLCVTFGALLLPLPEVLAMAVPISLLQTGYISVRHRAAIDWPLLLRAVLPLMGVGAAVGLLAFGDVSAPWMRPALGGLVLVLALRELFTRLSPTATTPGALPLALERGAIFGAGVVHGVFATGGPLLVYALGRKALDKHAFRSTVTAVWLVMNAVLCGAYLLRGRFDQGTPLRLLLLAPALGAGIAVGEALHRRVDEKRFQLAVFSLLALAALGLIVR